MHNTILPTTLHLPAVMSIVSQQWVLSAFQKSALNFGRPVSRMPSSKLASSLVEQTPQTACLQLPVLSPFAALDAGLSAALAAGLSPLGAAFFGRWLGLS